MQNNSIHPASILSGGSHDLTGRIQKSAEQKAREAQADRIRTGFEGHAGLVAARSTLRSLEDQALAEKAIELGLDPQMYSRAGLIEFGARAIVAASI